MTAASPASASRVRSHEPRTAFRPDIQGLRAIAVGGVLLYHAGLPFIGGGFVGVDVFFVISGFLITSHLFKALDAGGRIGFARFYARRARRILPASFAVLGATIAAILVWVPPTLQPGFLRDVAATALYVPNIFFAVQGTDYLAETAPSPLQHYWSLGVEEQFYVFWPVVLLVIWVFARRRRAGTAWTAFALAAVSFLGALLLTYSVFQPWAFFSLPTRAWELLAGGLTALAVPWIARWSRAVSAIAGWGGLAMIAASMLFIESTLPFPGLVALFPVLGTVLVIASGALSPVPGLEAVLAWRPMQFIGRISYSLYLVHWPLLVIPATAGGAGAVLSGWSAVLATVVSVPLAWVLYRFVEVPFQRAGWSVKHRPRVVMVVSLAMSLLFVALSVGTAAGLSRRSVDAGVSNDKVSSLTVPPVFSDVVPNNMTPSLTDAGDDLPTVYADGCHVNSESSVTPDGCRFGDTEADTVVALFGDSHAAQWFPVLDQLGREQGFRLDEYTKSSCPAADVTMVTDGVEDTGCSAWRASALSRMHESVPDLIIISGFAHYPEYGTSSVDSASWNAGLDSTLRALPGSSRVVVVTDTPMFATTPSTCLSVHVDNALKCSRERADALDASWNEAEAETARAAGATVVQVNDYLCDAQSCGLIIGDRLLYRDAHHLTASFTLLLAEPIWDAIRTLLPSLD
jgi:peptidoglycan/LPS O-acetylase OafA/YrhL